MSMDSVDEFEFKPLSQGLGFHKKQTTHVVAQTASPTPASTLTSTPILPATGPKLSQPQATAKTTAQPLITPPLPRKSYPLPGQEKQADPVADILKTLQKNKNLSFEKQSPEKTSATTKSDTYRLSPWMLSPSLLDSMLVAALTLLAMILVLVITKVDLIQILTTTNAEVSVYLATAILFATMAFVYLFGSRIVLGATPGEWAYELRIGNPQKQHSIDYALQVLTRSVLIIFTGFIVFPILSMLFGKDLLGKITGAGLYKKV